MANADMPATILHLVRVTIEAASPLSLASGEDISIKRRRRRDKEFVEEDARIPDLMRDANGLPTIPGSSLQGALRKLYAGDTRALFGYASGDQGAAARLFIGFGCVHDGENEAVSGLLDPKRFEECELLRALRKAEPEKQNYDMCGDDAAASRRIQAPNAIFLRDHVKLNERHVVDGRQKFERLAVPIGTRFSVEFSLWGAEEGIEADEMRLKAVVALVNHPAFRIGGAGRRGYGKVKLSKASYLRPDMARLDTVRSLRDKPPSEHFKGAGAKDWSELESTNPKGLVTVRLKLKPINPWRIGGSSPSMTECGFGPRLPNGNAQPQRGLEERQLSRRGKPDENGQTKPRDAADIMTIAREPWIDWSGPRVKIVEPGPKGPFKFIIPGSALKGPLVHRALFHRNRLMPDGGGVIDASALDGLEDDELKDKLKQLKASLDILKNRPQELEALFGTAKESATGGRADEKGNAARIYFDDANVDAVLAVQGIDHISIDRFTGGVRAGYLFVEEVVIGGTITATITILPNLPKDDSSTSDWHEDVRMAFCHALRDLCERRLAIGAKSLGYCVGDVVWTGDSGNPWERAWHATKDDRTAGQGNSEAAA